MEQLALYKHTIKELSSSFTCPKCYNPFGENHQPAALPCGHACCYSHVKDLKACPQCSHSIHRRKSIVPSSALMDAAKSFKAMKGIFDDLIKETENMTERYNDTIAKLNKELEQKCETTHTVLSTLGNSVDDSDVSANVVSVEDSLQSLSDEDWVLDMELESNSSPKKVKSHVSFKAEIEYDSDYSLFDNHCEDSPQNLTMKDDEANACKTSAETHTNVKGAWSVPGKLVKKLSLVTEETITKDVTPHQIEHNDDKAMDDEEEYYSESELIHSAHEDVPFRESIYLDYLDYYDPTPDYSDFFGSFGDALPPSTTKKAKKRKEASRSCNLKVASYMPPVTRTSRPHYFSRSKAPKIAKTTKCSRFVGNMDNHVNSLPGPDELNLASLFTIPQRPLSTNRAVPPEITVPCTAMPCGYWCTSTQNKCCHCADRRPTCLRYERYADGKGWVYDAKRSSMYCPVCK